MYKTTGIIDNSFYEAIKYHVYPKNRLGLLKFCIIIFALYYLLSAFLIRDLVTACVGIFGISLYTCVFFYTIKKYTKINMKRIQESYHTDSMDMSTEFTEEAMIISSSVSQDPTQIYYQDISRVVLTSKHYLIFTKAEQLICVFADQLQERDRLGLIGFLKEKAPKIKVYKEKARRKYFAGAGLILLYISFIVFLFGYFKKPEASADVNQNIQTDVSDIDLPEESAANKIIETEQPQTIEITYQIENPSWEYYCSDVVEEIENIPLKLEQVYEVENDITDLDVWLASNEITLSQFPYSDEKYFYTFTGAHFYEATGLMISEISGEKHIYSIDMNDFSMAPDKEYEENDPFTNNRGYVNFAKVKDNILYVSTGHRGYTVNNPSTGYVTAIDLENGEVLWKSAPQVSNAYNFEIVGDVIICGYGFTDEDDFLYILNRSNGQIMEQIPLKSMAEYIVAKDSMLYVRTYNRNYEFHIENLKPDSLSMAETYKAALHKVKEKHILPDGIDYGYDNIYDISENTFAVCDIDNDGRNELLINYWTTSYGANVLKIYGYDDLTGQLKEEFFEFPGSTLYSNGIIEAKASHNHGLASMSEEFWPYALYEYDQESDQYVKIADIDAWEKEYCEEYNGILFPEEADADGDGRVYYLMKNDVYEYKNPLDNDTYEKWRELYLKEAEEVSIQFLKMTEENIESISENDLKSGYSDEELIKKE